MKNRKRPRSQLKRSAPPPRIHDHSTPSPPEPPRPPQPRPESAPEPDPVPAQLARIDQISLVARTTWFGLLAYLAFVGVTLLGVEDADFFVPSRQTQLPLVNVAIPTSSFFWFAPLLGAALYAYLHLQLLKLWEALAKPPPVIGGKPLSEHVYPWLISDFALLQRNDGSIPLRPLRLLSGWTTRLLVWWSAPLILGGFWWRSMPAHHEGMTLWIALCMMLTLYIGFTSRRKARIEMRGLDGHTPWRGWLRRPMFATLCLLVVTTSWLRTEGGMDHYANRTVDLVNSTFRTFYFRDCFNRDANGHIIDRMVECTYPNGDDKDLDTVQRERIARLPLVWDLNDLTFDGATPLIGGWIGDFDTWTTLAQTDLAGVELVPIPDNLLDHTTERRRFRKTWCQRQGIDTETCGRLYSRSEPAPEHLERRRLDWCGESKRGIAPADCQPFFETLDGEFRQEWQQLWNSRTAALGKLDLSGVDLRRANLSGAFLIGVDLTNARMEGAILSEARMEGAILIEARMEGANLIEARMEGAYLSRARMEGANLSRARMEGAILIEARMEGAILSEARMEGADLRRARMEGAYLSRARMEGAILSEARMEGAILSEARMEGAILSEARMEGADLRRARMEGANLIEARMEGAYLSRARMEGANLSRARMEGAILDSANLKSAALTETFADTSVRAADLRSDDVTQQMLNNVFGDVATKFPGGLVRPDHWDTETLGPFDDDPKFEAWLRERQAAKKRQTTTNDN